MGSAPSILWHDYETSGTDPRCDRPMQFAALRTDLDLELAGEPVVAYCRLPDDVLPEPDACLMTGLTPPRIASRAVPEAVFMRAVLAELGRPATCGAGYNSLRFDDEVTRFGLWRNLLPVYDREWRDGSSRWDLLDPMRAAYALRPEGIEWPRNEKGEPSFRLEDLARANGIDGGPAHDALADVRSTIELARRLRRAQPKLYRYLFESRTKARVAELLDLGAFRPLVHVSGRFPAAQGYTSLVLPICRHPRNANGVIVVDLRHDPEPLLALPVEELRRLVFTPRADLEDGAPRIGVKQVHLNRCPVLAVPGVIDDRAAERIGLDRAACARHAEALRAARGLADRLAAMHAAEPSEPAGAAGCDAQRDADEALYDGFVRDADARRCRKVHQVAPAELRDLARELEDPRLVELLFRLRARSFPETLDAEEARRWQEHRRQKLFERHGDAPSRAEAVLQRIAALRRERAGDADALALLDELEGLARREP